MRSPRAESSSYNYSYRALFAFLLALVLLPGRAPATGISDAVSFSDDPVVTRLLPPSPPPASRVGRDDRRGARTLMSRAFREDPQSRERTRLLERAVAADPWNANANVQLGIAGMHATPGNMQSPESERAFQRLRLAFHEDARPQGGVARDSPQAHFLASIIARRAVELSRFDEAETYFGIAAASAAARGHCSAIQRATLITAHPHSPKHAKRVLARFHERMDALLRVNGRLDVSGVQDSDPFVFCVMTAFYHEIYYEGDLRAMLRKRYQVELKAFPELKYTARWLKKWERKRKRRRERAKVAGSAESGGAKSAATTTRQRREHQKGGGGADGKGMVSSSRRRKKKNERAAGNGDGGAKGDDDEDWDVSKVTAYQKTLDSDDSAHYGVAAAAPPTSLPAPAPLPPAFAPRQRPIKLGIAAGFFFPGNSVMADFSGVMDRLVTSGRFDITFVFFKEQPIALSAWDLRAVPKRADIKKVYEIGPWLEAKLRESRESGRNNVKVLMYERSSGPVSEWLGRLRGEIGGLRLDLLLYLDCTMSKMARRAAMSKLARVQAVSHGHPVTSGIPRGIVDYFVSWGNAELRPEQSRHHYTEDLALLPRGQMHQWYEPRVIQEEVEEDGSEGEGAATTTKLQLRSAVNGKVFGHIDREYFRREVFRAGMFGAGGGKDSGKRAKEAHATMMRVMQRRLMMQRQMSGEDKRVQVEEEEEEAEGFFFDEEGEAEEREEREEEEGEEEEEENFVGEGERGVFLAGFDELDKDEDMAWEAQNADELSRSGEVGNRGGLEGDHGSEDEEEIYDEQVWEEEEEEDEDEDEDEDLRYDGEEGYLREDEIDGEWHQDTDVEQREGSEARAVAQNEDDPERSPKVWRWYTCMQKPFKRHPLFDKMLARILEQDPRGVLLLHGTPGNPEAGKIMRTRLTKAGVDMSRVHFLPPQPHHALMALYALSDVVLDSYYAGGCTTTREALEVGAPVVTLPAKYLGGRWSLAYYQIMGMAARGQWLVARNKLDYVATAIKVAKNEGGFRDRVVQKIMENIGKLFRQEAAVEGWSALLERLAAV